ncbi:MAG: deoxyribodipyrimidine photolyase, partial [Pirellulales bacterium]
MTEHQVPAIRIRRLNDAAWHTAGDYVLYWMIAQRRPCYNFALDRAIELCRELDKPLVVLEALRCDYRWASDRLHTFVIQGMADNAKSFADCGVCYHPFVERRRGEGRGLLHALAERAAAVVTDEYPCFFLPQMVAAAARKIARPLEAVDGNGLLPLRAADREFARAYDFRRFLQKNLPPHLLEFPQPRPLDGAAELGGAVVPRQVVADWPAVSAAELAAPQQWLANLPIDHAVTPALFRGGHAAAGDQLRLFLENRFEWYGEQRSHPDDEAASELSPYLHFGHISPHEIFARVAEAEAWHPGKLKHKPTGARAGWWAMSETAEAFLDELVTWRELGFNMCWQRDDFDRYESLPEWARRTLEEHLDDERA